MLIERRVNGETRIKLAYEARLACSDGLAFDVTIVDVSSGGFRVRHHGADLDIGELVSIASSRRVMATGQIRWRTNEEAGGAFVDLGKHYD